MYVLIGIATFLGGLVVAGALFVYLMATRHRP